MEDPLFCCLVCAGLNKMNASIHFKISALVEQLGGVGVVE
jgi:hypothetical protein